MGETILLFDFGERVWGQLGSVAVEEVKSRLGVVDELDRMKSNLSSIQAVLLGAEKQQVTSMSVMNWLRKLQDVMYDIDDMLDDIATEVRIREMNKGQPRKQVRKFFSCTNTRVLRFRWAHQVKNLCKKLDQVAFERNTLSLSTEYVEPLETSSRETYSEVNYSKLILGRDQDKEAIINSILDCRDCESLSVLPIVGSRAIGKTTFARLIYDDSRIVDNFDKRLWVHVTKTFILEMVLMQVISMVTGESISQLGMEPFSMEQLRIKISWALKDKKYFLVLDELRSEDSDKCSTLRELLDVGAKGSMMVVTTHELKVASVVQSVDAYTLNELSYETCLEIFKHLAFKDGEKIELTLWDLAKKIVEKSRGLPFVVTTLGNLLRGGRDENEWCRIIEKLEQGHEDILNILRLSYDQLPSKFKLCFSITSLIGKGVEFYSLTFLLPLWMGLGFLPFDGQGEALARKCIQELLSKSLFNIVGGGGGIHTDDMFNGFSMHDFVHDFAKSMVGEESTIIDSSTKEVSKKVRYIKVVGDDLLGMQCYDRLLNHAKKARLLMPHVYSLSKAFMETMISKLTLLRVLYFPRCQFKELPRTIGYMKHLRYLSLIGNTRIKRLPSSICDLINLQTLILIGCTNLEELSADIGRLENLKIFMLTTKQKFLPEGIGYIKGLRTFALVQCQRLACLPVSIKQLENLDTLFIDECKELDLEHGSWSLEGLNSLRLLCIAGLSKFQKLPMGDKGLPFTSLQYIELINCEGLMGLEDWVKYFTCLKELYIGNCPNLTGFPHTPCLLEKLEKLTIEDCPILSERCTPEKGNDWHLLSNIPYIRIDGKMIKNDI